jgi:hypothetical protein
MIHSANLHSNDSNQACFYKVPSVNSISNPLFAFLLFTLRSCFPRLPRYFHDPHNPPAPFRLQFGNAAVIKGLGFRF